jgi:hypothetical protein
LAAQRIFKTHQQKMGPLNERPQNQANLSANPWLLPPTTPAATTIAISRLSPNVARRVVLGLTDLGRFIAIHPTIGLGAALKLADTGLLAFKRAIFPAGNFSRANALLNPTLLVCLTTINLVG